MAQASRFPQRSRIYTDASAMLCRPDWCANNAPRAPRELSKIQISKKGALASLLQSWHEKSNLTILLLLLLLYLLLSFIFSFNGVMLILSAQAEYNGMFANMMNDKRHVEDGQELLSIKFSEMHEGAG